jgi:hypothetical protein
MFKIGDRIRCVNSSGVGSDITIGKTYIIFDLTEDCVRIIDNTGTKYGYYDYRFELVEKEPKIIKQFGIVAFMKGINV